MEEILLMDPEEVILLIGSIISLLLTFCYIFYFIKFFQKKISFIDIPIISLLFCYLNSYVFYIYSKYILHDSMTFFYCINTIISVFLIIIYLIIEYNKDKFDTILNILILIFVSLSINKLLFKELNDEDKIKICCCYSTFGLFSGLFFSIFKDIHIKSSNMLNFYIDIILIFLSGCYYFYGFYFKEKMFIYPNLLGIIIGIIYIGFFLCLNSKYAKDFREGDSIIGIDIKNENKEGKDINRQYLIDGNIDLPYAALIKNEENKKNKDSNLLIKNNNNQTIEVSSKTNSLEIDVLLDNKYKELQKQYEEKKLLEKNNENNSSEYNNTEDDNNNEDNNNEYNNKENDNKEYNNNNEDNNNEVNNNENNNKENNKNENNNIEKNNANNNDKNNHEKNNENNNENNNESNNNNWIDNTNNDNDKNNNLYNYKGYNNDNDNNNSNLYNYNDYTNDNDNNNFYNNNGNNNMIISSKIEESDKTKGGDEGLIITKKSQVKYNLKDLSSYLEIPFQFNNYNYSNNNTVNLKNYLKFDTTPILTINLKSEEDENLLILDDLKRENDEYDAEFEQIEKRLEQAYNEHSKLLEELAQVNNDLKSAENEMEQISKQIKDTENKNLNDINEINIQKNEENAALDILLSQENFINLKKCHDILLNDKEYLNHKFSDEFFDENQIRADLTKDIIDFQQFNKNQMEQKTDKIESIKSSLIQLLEINKYDYNLYAFGSYATGLCLPWSDLDLILISKNKDIKNYNIISVLQEIKNVLNNENWIFTPNLIENYVFPYITFSTDENHGSIKVNLTIQDSKNNGYRSIKIIQDFLNIYKNLEPLTLVIKELMKCSNILFSLGNYSISNKSETLNSYSIILMIVYYFQFKLMGIMDSTIDMINDPDNLGELFLNFLFYYINYDYNGKNYIFVRTGLTDSIESDDYLYLNSFISKLIIIDPLDHKNNVSLHTGYFRNIPNILKKIYYSSNYKCYCSCHYLKNYNNYENKKYIDLGTQHCILKKIFQTASSINSNKPKIIN